MRLRYLSILSVVFVAACSSSNVTEDKVVTPEDPIMVPESSMETISAKELRKHLTFIASDELKGRDTGSPELDIAARYLAAHLESYGYKGIGPDGSFFQDVPLHKTAFENKSLSVRIGDDVLEFTNGEDIAAYGFGTSNIDLTAPLVAIGDGLYLDEKKSYEPADVEGKIAVRFQLDSTDQAKVSENYNYLHQYIRNATFDNGAKAVIYVIDDEDTADQLIRRYYGISEGFNMTLNLQDKSQIYLLMKRSVFDQIAKLNGMTEVPNREVVTFEKPLSIGFDSRYEKIYSKNVVGYLEGSDSLLSQEFVGFGAHYDHVGYRDTLIFNGADDDGSGTVGVLNIAKAISENPPKRSTFIIFHTGEEKGLFGSEYYSENPLLPMENMVAMVNMDMIGSDYENEKVHVVGADRISQELHDINELMNSRTSNMELDYTYNADDHPERIYYRSDHYNYARKGVPVIFFTNDNPLHYHQPSDEVSTINFDKMERIAKLALATGYYVANKDERIVITNPVEPEEE